MDTPLFVALAAILMAFLAFLLGKSHGASIPKESLPLPPPLPGPEDRKKEEEVERRFQEEVKSAHEDHDQALEKAIEEMKKKQEEAVSDPKKVLDYLDDVGRRF